MVRLMLLERLLQNLPQLRNVGGVRAIPYMQVSGEGSELSPNQTGHCFLFARAFLLLPSHSVSPSVAQHSLPQIFAGCVPFLSVALQLTEEPEGSNP